MLDLHALWETWSGPAGAVLGAVGGFYTRVFQARVQEQRNQLDAGNQALTLLGATRAREQMLTDSYVASLTREQALHAQVSGLAGTLQTILEQTIGARLRVRELEIAAGQPHTEFPPLPAWPVAVLIPNVELDAAQAAGAVAVDAAKPGAGSTHG